MRRFFLLVGFVIVAPVVAQEKPRTAGPTETGYLLPNGWHLTPTGKHFITTDLPLNIIPLKDGKHALVATSGYNRHELTLVDLSGPEPKAVSSATVARVGSDSHSTRRKRRFGGRAEATVGCIPST